MILAAEMMQKDLPMKFIKEWVEWHDYLGFDKLYLFDHFSKDKLEYDHPKVQVFHADKKLIEAYPHCPDANYKYYAMSWWWDYLINNEEWDWMAFIDSDEFVMLPAGDCIKDALTATGGDAVALNWKNFGPADYEHDPEDTLLSYDKFAKHHAIKVVAKKESLVSDHNNVMNCHLPPLKADVKFVNPRGKELEHKCYDFDEAYQKGLGDWEHIWINHYHLRSREDWLRKQQSMESTNKSEMPWYWDEEHFQGCIRNATEIDTTAKEHRNDT